MKKRLQIWKKNTPMVDFPFQDLLEQTPDTPQSKNLIFSNIAEFILVFFGILYSLFCFWGYILDFFHISLSVINLSLFLLAVPLIIGYYGYKKIRIEKNDRTLFLLYSFIVYRLLFHGSSPPHFYR